MLKSRIVAFDTDYYLTDPLQVADCMQTGIDVRRSSLWRFKVCGSDFVTGYILEEYVLFASQKIVHDVRLEIV